MTIIQKFIKQANKFFSYKCKAITYSDHEEEGVGPHFLYAPHPYTNWGLNPGYKNQQGELLHFREGFRKTGPEESLQQFLSHRPNDFKIYCVGGSSTYCTGVPNNDHAWPNVLQRLLNTQHHQQSVSVINAGVAAWGTLNSFIRFSTWSPSIKPNLIIIYQAKNDFMPLYNGRMSERKVYPDYSNIVGQISYAISSASWWRRLKSLAGLNHGISTIYGDDKTTQFRGFERIDDEFMESIVFRYLAIFKMASLWDAQVLYIPEIVTSGPYKDHVDALADRVMAKLDDYPNVWCWDPRQLIPQSSQYFQDKMHFTAEGCDLFAKLLAKNIAQNAFQSSVKMSS